MCSICNKKLYKVVKFNIKKAKTGSNPILANNQYLNNLEIKLEQQGLLGRYPNRL